MDFWSITHFFGGSTLGGASWLLVKSFWVGLIIAILFMILWEIFESTTKIKETIKNRVLDVMVGTTGFLITYSIIDAKILNNLIFFSILASIFLILDVWGLWTWKHYQ